MNYRDLVSEPMVSVYERTLKNLWDEEVLKLVENLVSRFEINIS